MKNAKAFISILWLFQFNNKIAAKYHVQLFLVSQRFRLIERYTCYYCYQLGKLSFCVARVISTERDKERFLKIEQVKQNGIS